MTQHQLIVRYIKQYGSILPAKLYGEMYMGQMFGSELSKRARELRKKGILRSEKDGRFERFYLKHQGNLAPILSAFPFKEKVVETQKLF